MHKILVVSNPDSFQKLIDHSPTLEFEPLGAADKPTTGHLIVHILDDGYKEVHLYHEDALTLVLSGNSAFWPKNLTSHLATLSATSNSRLNRDLDIVDQIQAVRTRNNMNWMELLRVGLTHAPDETKAIFRRVSADDQEINRLLSELVAED